MCSIGWLKLKDSWILFKNRDRSAGESKENILIKDNTLIGFGDKKFPGLWIGMNKYGVGVTSAYGPIKDVPEVLNPENFNASEEVLRKCWTAEEGVVLYLELAKNIGRSFNVLIADSSRAITLELILKDSSRVDFNKIAAKTNYFTELKKYNNDKEKTDRSAARLGKLTQLLPEVKNADDLIKVLGFHSESNEYENICRHDKSETVASAIFEVKDKQVKVFYSLNEFPHNKNFKEKIISF